jgi:hypothetical protein
MNTRLKAGLFLMMFLSLAAASCFAVPVPAQIRSHSEEVELDGADSVQVEILMGAGRLMVGGNAAELMEGEFTYSRRAYAPDISYHVSSNGTGKLEIRQDDNPGIQIHSNFRNDWELSFNNQVPLQLDVTLGAGESDLNLEGLVLESFNLKLGAGASRVDLSGDLEQDLTVQIQGGVGELTLLLPANTNIDMDVNGGLGEINTSGLYRENSHFISKYSGTGPTIFVDIDAGVGQLNLLAQ